jgi:cobalamin synthase
VVPSLAACFLCSWVIYEAARRRFGGITGDVLGAAEQLSEVVVLVIAAGVVASRWPGLPWWR